MDHVLLESDDDDDRITTFSPNNPFANPPPQQDWKAKLGAFGKRAADAINDTSKVALAKVNSTIDDIKVRVNTEFNNNQQEQDIQISGPMNARRVENPFQNVPSPTLSPSSSSQRIGSEPPQVPKKPSQNAMGPKKTPVGSPRTARAQTHFRVASSNSDTSHTFPLQSRQQTSGNPLGVRGYGSGSNTPQESMSRSNSSSSVRSPRPLVFGVSLKIAVSDADGNQIYKIPPIITDCIEQLHKKGLKEEGIFRVGGSHATVNQYKDRYNRGEQVDLSIEKDVNNISSLLKLYLRELPEHLFTEHLLPLFDNAILDPDQADTILAQLLPLLPETNLLILQALFKLLVAIAKTSSVNMMTVSNLGIIFTQVLRINGSLFAYLMSKPQIIESAIPAQTVASTEKDLIQW